MDSAFGVDHGDIEKGMIKIPKLPGRTMHSSAGTFKVPKQPKATNNPDPRFDFAAPKIAKPAKPPRRKPKVTPGLGQVSTKRGTAVKWDFPAR